MCRGFANGGCLQENGERRFPVDYQFVCEGVEEVVPSEGAAGVISAGAGSGAGAGAGAGAGFFLTTRFLVVLLAFFFIAFLTFFFFFAKTRFTEVMFQLWKPNNAFPR
jgi:hypothetical protein